MSATEGCYGNQRRFGGDSENWCVTMATASFRRAFLHRLWQTQSFWASRAVHTRTRSFPLLLRRPLCHPTFFLSVKPRVKCNPLFVNIHSVPSQGSPASQAQVAYSTAYTDKQTRAIHTKTCSLTFLSSHLNTVTMTFISPEAGKKRTKNKTGCAPARDRARDGAWRRRDEPRTRKVFPRKNKKHQLSRSVFTAAWATGTENKHQTVKKQKKQKKHCFWIHYWEEWVSWLTGIKRNRGCTERVEPTWCCHGNHIPLWRRGRPTWRE